MKSYSGKTVEEALEAASLDLGVSTDELIYSVQEKKKGLFTKKLVVDVYEIDDIIKFAEDYILSITDSLEIESTLHSIYEDGLIRITLDSTHNPILIGKNGSTLKALNELTKLAVSNHFRRRFRILLDLSLIHI